MIWGRPIVNDDMKLWANFGMDLSDTLTLYGHANYNSKEVDGGFFFRNPTNRGAVYSGDGGETLLIGDLTQRWQWLPRCGTTGGLITP